MCGSVDARRHGRDRQGRQLYRCCDCRSRFTALSGTPSSGYSFPSEIFALAVRWYLRYRLSYANAAALLAERGVSVDPSTIYAWAREFAPLYKAAARPYRKGIGSAWNVDETYIKVAGAWAYVYRAIDGRGQVVDVYVSAERAAEDVATFFRRAIEATGVVPAEVATNCAAAYPPALAAVLPTALHETGKLPQQRIERGHQHLKGQLCGTRGFKTFAGARVMCRAHAFLRNVFGNFYDLERLVVGTLASTVPLPLRAWDALTADLLGQCPTQRLLGSGYSGSSFASHTTAQLDSTGQIADIPPTDDAE